MDNMIDFALMRHGEIADEIEKREAEIENLREQKEKLEVFVATAQELAELVAAKNKNDCTSLQEEQKAGSSPAPARVMPARHAQSA
ncbi:MAG: hypothetical protein HKN27_02355 [Silicimonas sp.]|nr:hypothetical protein [Silicimonas sp.]